MLQNVIDIINMNIIQCFINIMTIRRILLPTILIYMYLGIKKQTVQCNLKSNLLNVSSDFESVNAEIVVLLQRLREKEIFLFVNN